MKVNLKVKLEAKHYLGAGHSGDNCPLQRALKEAAGTKAGGVGGASFMLNGYNVPLPKVCSEIVTAWDKDNARTYTEFEVEVPDKAVSLIGMQ